MSLTTYVIGAVSAVAATAPSFWWASPAATLIATTFAGVFAYFQIRTNRQMTRLRASLDLIERTESQEFYQKMRQGFRASAKKSFQNLSDDERKATLYTLNHYEIIAIGCFAGVLDKEFYKKWMRTTYVLDWRASEPFIWTLRHPPSQPPKLQLFVAFERLAKEWEREWITGTGATS